MELSIKRSKIHLLIIVLAFGWAIFSIWYSSWWLVFKLTCTLFVVCAAAFEWFAWRKTPLRASLRREKIFLHSRQGSTEPVLLAGARIQLFWIGFRKRRSLSRRIYIFQDSFSKRDWCALRRAIKSAG